MAVLDIKTGSDSPDIDCQIAAYLYLANFGQCDGLEFDPEHHVFTGNGTPILSVTTVLKKAEMTPDYSMLDPWYASKGGAVHLATELDDKGILDEDTIDDAVRPYLDAYRLFRRDSVIAIKNIEVRKWCPKYQFGGIIDRIVEGQYSYKLFLKKTGKYKLVEVKNIQGHFNYFLSALVLLNGNPGAGKDIARLNIQTWIKRHIRRAA